MAFCCDRCGACFATGAALVKHMERCTPKPTPPSPAPIPRYCCSTCGACFGSIDLLTSHVKAKHPTPPPAPPAKFVCSVCGASFATSEALFLHMDRVHPAPVGALLKPTTEAAIVQGMTAEVNMADLLRIRDEAVKLLPIADVLAKTQKEQKAALRYLEEAPISKSPITLEEALAVAGGVEGALDASHLAISLALVAAEAASLGQLDVTLLSFLATPTYAGSLAGGVELAKARISETLVPYVQRYWRRLAQPNIPPYADMIAIAVREGWMPEKWVEIPPEWLEWMKELGFSEKWSKMLWGKHWVLPSVSQLYEMLHRRLIDEKKMAAMLRVHDIEPEWRDKLMAISYNIFRIVDARRGWELGILSDDDLEEWCLDYGYHPKKLTKILAIEKAIALEAEIGALRKEYIDMAIDDEITEEELKKKLADLKVLHDRDWYFLELVRIKKARKALKIKKKAG